jgi:hypothetical protein
MKPLGLTAALIALALLTASCRPPGPEPSDNLPPSRPADAPAQAAESPGQDTQPTPDQPDAGQTDATSTKKKSPPSTGARVLGAIGKAVRNSVTGERQD